MCDHALSMIRESSLSPELTQKQLKMNMLKNESKLIHELHLTICHTILGLAKVIHVEITSPIFLQLISNTLCPNTFQENNRPIVSQNLFEISCHMS
jgi:hypothetical protein